MTKKLIIALSLLLLPLLASADAVQVEIDGIYYNLFEETGQAEVTKNPNNYGGNVEIPESVVYEEKNYRVTNIGDGAFYGCSLTSLTIPNSVTFIGEFAFVHCHHLSSIYVDNGNPKYDSRNDCNAIIETSSNTLIAGCKNTIIPNSVTNIGDGAFYGCSLTSLTIPNSVTSIGANAFNSCAGLTSLTIPNSVTSIGAYAFFWCYSLTSVIIGNSVTSICDGAFSTCGALTSLTIPNSVTSIGSEAFYQCYRLTSVTIPNSVISIGNSAFSGCSGLPSVTIPNSVTSIGNGAFSGCSGLTSINVDNGNSKYDSRNDCNAIIETLSSTLIAGCKNTIIPNSVTSIGNSAFSGCRDLPSVTIHNDVTSIGNSAFSGCISLTSVTIPNSVTNIGDGAFSGCSGLTSMIIPNSVTSIANGAFSGCSGLTSVNIPNSITSIGQHAFTLCSGLTSVTIPNSVTSIDHSAFNGCNFRAVISLIENPFQIFGKSDDINTTFSPNTFENATLYVPVGTIDKYKATEGWNDFMFIKERDKAETYKLTYVVDSEVINSYDLIYGEAITPEPAPTREGYTFSGWSDIPETMPAHDVVVTGTFIQNEQTTEFTVGDVTYDITGEGTVTIVSSNQKGDVEIQSTIDINGQTFYVTAIGDYAFKDNQYILSVIIPNGVNNIGYFAFGGCSKMTSITIPNSVNTIGESAFQGCSSLISVDIPYGISSIKRGTFHGCSSLESVVLPNSVTSIVGGAFSYCSSLTNIEIPEGVLSIESGTFFECNGLTSVLIPNSVTSIGDNAFYGCSSLSSIEIPSSVSSIGYAAFAHCKSLTSFQIPDGVTTIENNVFACSSSLEAITIPNDVVSIGNFAFTQCENLKHINMPSNLTSIGNGAFYRCSSLSSVSIPSGVTSIGFNAFEGSNITSVISKVEYPFDIIGKASLDRTFSQYTSENAILYVPFGTTDIYKSTEGWKDFENIIEGSPDGIKSINYYLIGDESSQYLLNGQKTSNPQKGVNIIRMQDGKTKKIIVK